MFGLGKKKEEKKEIELGSTIVHVVVKKQHADNLLGIIAEFDVMQVKDKNFNLVLQNLEKQFKEDYNLSTLQAIKILDMRLSGKTESQKLEAIKTQIEKQQARIKNIRDGFYFTDEDLKKYEDKTADDKTKEALKKIKVNSIDEEQDLKFLELLQETLMNKGVGSFEEINLRGQRQISFIATDGVLIPIFNNSIKKTAYPDVSQKRKLYGEYSERNEMDWQNAKKNKFIDFFKGAGMILMLILFILNILGSYRLNQEYSKLAIDKQNVPFCSMFYNDLTNLEINETQLQEQADKEKAVSDFIKNTKS